MTDPFLQQAIAFIATTRSQPASEATRSMFDHYCTAYESRDAFVLALIGEVVTATKWQESKLLSRNEVLSEAKRDFDAAFQQPLTAVDAFIGGVHQAYRMVALGAVTRIDPLQERGGLSFVLDEVERKFLLSVEDLTTLHHQVGSFLAIYQETKSHVDRSGDGARSVVLTPDEVEK